MKASLTRNRIKRSLCIALSIVLIVGFVPMRTKADYYEKYTYKISTLKQNTPINALGDQSDYQWDEYTYDDYYYYTYHMYKITVPATGCIKITASNKSTGIGIYKQFNRNDSLGYSDTIASFKDQNTYYTILPKGTYYINVDDNTRLRWTYTKISNKTNYCRARASALKSGKKPIIVFNYRYEHDKWYKIRLTKKKKITVTLKTLDKYGIDFSLYDSRGKRIECPLLSGNSYQTARMPKGIYYIRLRREDGTDDYGRICQLWWK